MAPSPPPLFISTTANVHYVTVDNLLGLEGGGGGGGLVTDKEALASDYINSLTMNHFVE